MFETFELQYLNKLVESKIGDFASPEAFHCLKVQRLGGDKVKPLTQVSRTFVVPISALVGDFAIESCEFTDGTPPIVRTFLLSTDSFVEFAELVQGVFQGLRMVEFLTVAECQIGLHSEVYAHAFTCGAHNFFGYIICYNIEIECSDSIPTDLDILDVSLRVAMVMIQDEAFVVFVELLGFRIPLPKRNANTPFFKQVACLKLRGAILFPLFELRRPYTSTAPAFLDPIKESLVGDMDTDNHLIECISRYPCPVLLGALEQLRQVRLQSISTGVFPIDAVIPLFQSKEVVVNIAEVIEHVAHAHILWMLTYLIFIGSHGVTSYQFLTPNEWVGRHATGAPPVTGKGAVTLVMSANWS